MRFLNVTELLKARETTLKKQYDKESNVLIKNDIGFEILEVQDAMRVLNPKRKEQKIKPTDTYGLC
jgi:hypothetical protein